MPPLICYYSYLGGLHVAQACDVAKDGEQLWILSLAQAKSRWISGPPETLGTGEDPH